MWLKIWFDAKLFSKRKLVFWVPYRVENFLASISSLTVELCLLKKTRGHAVVQLVEALCYKPKVVGSIPDSVIGIVH